MSAPCQVLVPVQLHGGYWDQSIPVQVCAPFVPAVPLWGVTCRTLKMALPLQFSLCALQGHKHFLRLC